MGLIDVRPVAQSTETAKNVFAALFERERSRKETNLQQTRYLLMREGYKIAEHEYMKLWQDLEQLGIGSIIEARGNKGPRFKWHYNLKDVVRSVRDGETLSAADLMPTTTAPAPTMLEAKPKPKTIVRRKKRSQDEKPAEVKNEVQEQVAVEQSASEAQPTAPAPGDAVTVTPEGVHMVSVNIRIKPDQVGKLFDFLGLNK